MITIFRGKHARATDRDLEGAGVVLRAIDADGSPWAGLRAIAEQARRAFGDARWKDATGPLRDGVEAALLPNAILRDRAIYAAWAASLAGLLAGERAGILVPEIGAIDLESLQALRAVVRAARGKAELTLAIGHDTARVETDPREAFLRARHARELAFLEALTITRVIERDGAAEATPAAGEPRRPASLATLREAFAAYAFEPAVRQAARLLDGDTTLSGEDARDALRLGGLALYNLAALSRDEWSGGVLRDRFTRLLALETEPLPRAHCQYRLAMIHARGRGDFDAALAAANAAVTEAERGADDARAPLFAGWAHNGRAYVEMRQGDMTGAADDTEAGYRALAKPSGALPSLEVEVARMLVANNRARVAQMIGDGDALAKWNALRVKHYDAIAVQERPGATWTPAPEDDRDLAAMREHHASLLTSARDALDPESEAIAAHGLGVALYKLGDAKAAHDAFATSLRIWTITRGFAEDLLTEELNLAVTAFRCGDTARAEEGFARVRASSLMQNDAAQAETLAALAMIDARAKNPRAAARADEAVAAAEAAGEPDVLVRTLRSAAEARLIAGDRAAALSFVARARAVIASVESDGGELPPEDVLGVLVTGLDAAERADPADLRRAIAVAPSASSDANAWWDLPRLGLHLQRDQAVARDPSLAEPLAVIARIIRQRSA